MVIVSAGDRRVENRNLRGFRCVNKRGSSSGRAATGGAARPGGPLGSGVSSGLFAREAAAYVRAARTTREKARDRHPAGRPVGPVSRPRVPCLLGETPGHARSAGRPGAGRTAGRAGRGDGAPVPDEFLRHREPDRLGRGSGRPGLPPRFPPAGHAARGRRAAAGPPDRNRGAGGGAARRRARDPDAAQPAPGRAVAAERAEPARQAAARPAAQVPGDRAVLPPAGPDLPCVLHLLLPVGAVRGRAGPEDGHGRHRRAGRLPRPAPGGDQRPDHRRGSDDHGRAGAAALPRAAARSAAGSPGVDQDRHQVAVVLAAAVRHRSRRRRDAAAVRRGGRLGPDARADGALLPSARARAVPCWPRRRAGSGPPAR